MTFLQHAEKLIVYTAFSHTTERSKVYSKRGADGLRLVLHVCVQWLIFDTSYGLRSNKFEIPGSCVISGVRRERRVDLEELLLVCMRRRHGLRVLAVYLHSGCFGQRKRSTVHSFLWNCLLLMGDGAPLPSLDDPFVWEVPTIKSMINQWCIFWSHKRTNTTSVRILHAMVFVTPSSAEQYATLGTCLEASITTQACTSCTAHFAILTACGTLQYPYPYLYRYRLHQDKVTTDKRAQQSTMSTIYLSSKSIPMNTQAKMIFT